MKKLLLTVLSGLVALFADAQLHKGLKIAFLADVHLQDLYGNFSDTDYKGITNPVSGKTVLMRTMDAQLHSTRIFNENYFAFLAALDDMANRGIKIIALPGDYTDDGQAIHVRGLKRILDEYTRQYGMQFFITTGNHDPVGPFEKAAGKNDFLGQGGKNQPVYSKQNMYAPKKNELPVVITKDIATLGYEGITDILNNFGFMPQKEYLYWSTPYSSYEYKKYTYSKALNESRYSTRKYDIVPGFNVPDATYVAEPVEGLWLLALDGNVYIPKKNNDGDAVNPDNYTGASVGYNNVLSNKQHLIKWVARIAGEAKKNNKTLIAFSHYPMADFNDGASSEITSLLGKGKWQMDRLPVETVAQSFADAGLRIHFAGHMHINDTGTYHGKNGNNLINIQTPSLAAYIPAYKLLTVQDNEHMEIETVVIDDVPRFNELFTLYETEYEYLEQSKAKDIWNNGILQTKNYHDFTEFHLKELVRLRFIPQEWPKEFADYFISATGYELIINGSGTDVSTISAMLKKSGLNPEVFKQWTGMDFITDLYRLQSADGLALQDITNERLKQYNIIISFYKNNKKKNGRHSPEITLFCKIFEKLLHGEPAGNFKINLKKGTVIPIKK